MNRRWQRWIDGVATFAVVGLTAFVAISMFLDYRADPAQLWRDPYHDRNTHFLAGLDLALAIRSWDVAGFVQLVTGHLVWPPLHGLTLALVLLIGGMGLELAIVPSLVGWWATIVLIWLLARRIFGGGPIALVSGTVAVVFAITSPAFRLLGSDVMLEGLGSALSAAAVYAALRCLEHPTTARARLLALLLSLLFFEKYNYWLLTATAIAVSVAMDAGMRRQAAAALGGIARRLGLPLLRNPAGLLGVVVIILSLLAPPVVAIPMFGRDFVLAPATQLSTIGYGFLLVAVCWWWRANRGELALLLHPAIRTILAWHGLPVALWLLVPGALPAVVWFVGPSHRGATESYDPWAAIGFHWAGFSEGFHATPWLGAAALPLAVAGAIHITRRGGGERLIPVLAAISVLAVVLHPHQQWRFQATSLFALWACAGAGAAALVRLAQSVLAPRLVAGLSLVALGAFIWASAVQRPGAMAAMVAIRTPHAPSDLELARAYLPLVDRVDPIGFAATIGLSDLFAWTVRWSCRCRAVVEQPWVPDAKSRQEAGTIAEQWIASTSAERIVFIDMPALYELPGRSGLRGRLLGVRDGLRAQDRFVPVQTASIGKATIEVFRRQPESARRPPPVRWHILDGLSALFGLAAIAILSIRPRRDI